MYICKSRIVAVTFSLDSSLYVVNTVIPTFFSDAACYLCLSSFYNITASSWLSVCTFVCSSLVFHSAAQQLYIQSPDVDVYIKSENMI